ncbi:MAG: glycosyltransferase [Thermoguttaceae bacterium]
MRAEPTAQRRLRVLQLSYACSPERGSEAAVGWHRAVQSAKHFDTWVICEEHEFAGEIRRYLAEHGDVPGLHFVFVPIDQREWSWGQVHDSIWYAVLRRWHRRAFRVARRLHQQLHFDLVHQVTFCGYREPGCLWRLDAPFVWGPVGGTQDYPWRFLPAAGIKGAAQELSRSVVNRLQLRLSPRVRAASRRAATILAANSTVERDLAAAHGVKPQLLLETGLAKAEGDARTRESRGLSLRILWSGLLTHRKALHLLLEALALLPSDVPYELRVVGEGPLERRWQRLAERLDIAPHVAWLGRLSHADALRLYDATDLFVFTSLRDTSGNVVLEALAAGVPVVCLDHQGMRDIVTADCGVKIPVSTPRDVVLQLKESIVRLWREPAEWERLSRGAVERAKEFLWSKQEATMTALYRDVVGRSGRLERQNLPKASGVHLAARQRKPSTMKRSKDHPFGILMYHRVAPGIEGVEPPTWNTTPGSFRRQLGGLLARGWHAWPLARALAHRRVGEPIPRRTFVVTFDDGYDNVHQNAWPILRELSVPATVFVTTSCLDGDRPFTCDDWTAAGSPRVPVSAWRPLTTAHCAEMLDSGLVEIGSHTHTHADLREQPGLLGLELAQSVDLLRDRFGLKEIPFAFPFGHTGPEMKAIARESGVNCALTAEAEPVVPGSDPFAWGRFAVRRYDTAATLAVKLGGWYSTARNAWRLLRHPRTLIREVNAGLRGAQASMRCLGTSESRDGQHLSSATMGSSLGIDAFQ